MGNINCCKKPNDEPVLDTNDKSNDIIKDKDDYPHDSDPAFRKRRKLNSNSSINEKLYDKKDENVCEVEIEAQKKDENVEIQENDNDNPTDQKNNDIEEERDKNLEESGDNEIYKE